MISPKIKFNNYQNINQNYSQAGQDLFVLSAFDGKKNGSYLDLGCSHPTHINNTWMLEKDFEWFGLSIDIDNGLINSHKQVRKNPSLNLDCTKLDFFEIINHYDNKNYIDYLSLDLEPAKITYECLLTIPFNEISFGIITYEHDYYRFGEEYEINSRKILESFGYKRICSGISDNNSRFEDWYYNPTFVDYEKIKILESENKNWNEVILD
jgi:hypothetical protein